MLSYTNFKWSNILGKETIIRFFSFYFATLVQKVNRSLKNKPPKKSKVHPEPKEFHKTPSFTPLFFWPKIIILTRGKVNKHWLISFQWTSNLMSLLWWIDKINNEKIYQTSIRKWNHFVSLEVVYWIKLSNWLLCPLDSPNTMKKMATFKIVDPSWILCPFCPVEIYYKNMSCVSNMSNGHNFQCDRIMNMFHRLNVYNMSNGNDFQHFTCLKCQFCLLSC